MNNYIKKSYWDSILKYFFTLFFLFYVFQIITNIIFENPFSDVSYNLRILFDFFSVFISAITFTAITSYMCRYEKKILNSSQNNIYNIICTLENKGYTKEIGIKNNILYKSNIQKFYFGKIFIFKDCDNIYIYASKPLLKNIIGFIN